MTDNKRHTLHHLLQAAAIACLMLPLSCTKTPDGEQDGNRVMFSSEHLEAVMPDGSPRTYRIVTYISSGGAKYSFNADGTYYLKQGDNILTPCDVNGENGQYLSNNPEAGYNGSGGSVILVAVSPAVQHNGDGSFSFVPTAPESGKLLTSFPKARSITGSKPISMEKLKDCRSTVAFKFYKESGTSLDIRNPKLSGAGAAGEAVTLYPASRQVAVSKDSLAIVLNETAPEADGKGNELCHQSEPQYIAAAIYAPFEETAAHLKETETLNLYKGGSYLSLSCTLIQEERQVDVSLPLTADLMELEPQHRYAFKIMVASDYINLTVDIFAGENGHDWETGGSEGGEITAPDHTLNLGEWKIVGNGDDWEIEDLGEQIIG